MKNAIKRSNICSIAKLSPSSNSSWTELVLLSLLYHPASQPASQPATRNSSKSTLNPKQKLSIWFLRHSGRRPQFFWRWKTTSNFANGRRHQLFCEWKTTSTFLWMELKLNFFLNGRRPQIFGKWKTTSKKFKWKTTSIYCIWKWTSILSIKTTCFFSKCFNFLL